jgi:hypothetical protein
VSRARVWLLFAGMTGCASSPQSVPRLGDPTAASVLTRMCKTYEAMTSYVDSETLVRHDAMRDTNIVNTMMKRPSRFHFETSDHSLTLMVPARFVMWQTNGLVQSRDPDGNLKTEPSIVDIRRSIRERSIVPPRL